MRVMVDLRPEAAVAKFLEGYTEFDKQSHPDDALKPAGAAPMVSLGFGDGTFLSLGDDGRPNTNVSPAGHAPTPGANERFNDEGGALIHDKSGLALPCSLPIAGLP